MRDGSLATGKTSTTDGTILGPFNRWPGAAVTLQRFAPEPLRVSARAGDDLFRMKRASLSTKADPLLLARCPSSCGHAAPYEAEINKPSRRELLKLKVRGMSEMLRFLMIADLKDLFHDQLNSRDKAVVIARLRGWGDAPGANRLPVQV